MTTQSSPTVVHAQQSTLGAPSEPARRSNRRRYKEWLTFIAFAGPNVVIIAVFGLWPVVYNGVLSFTDWNMISPSPTFVGLRNYVWVVTSPEFAKIAKVTLIFIVAVVVLTISLGLAMAILLNQPLKGRNVARTLAFTPYVLSGAAVAMIWLFIFDPNFGLARIIFNTVGAASPHWVTSPSWALVAIIITYIWRDLGFATIVYISALQALPKDLYEAAEIDGAGGLQKFTKLTLPLLSPTTFFLVVMETIGASKTFDIIMVMTNGGPGKSTSVLSWAIYKKAFIEFNLGQATASAMILFFFLLVVFALQVLFLERKVHYQ